MTEQLLLGLGIGKLIDKQEKNSLYMSTSRMPVPLEVPMCKSFNSILHPVAAAAADRIAQLPLTHAAV
jgi:hypothetical protein